MQFAGLKSLAGGGALSLVPRMVIAGFLLSMYAYAYVYVCTGRGRANWINLGLLLLLLLLLTGGSVMTCGVIYFSFWILFVSGVGGGVFCGIMGCRDIRLWRYRASFGKPW